MTWARFNGIVIILSCVWLAAANGWGQEGAPPAPETGNEDTALIELLEKKGILTFDEAYDLKQRAGQPQQRPHVDETMRLTPVKPSEKDLEAISEDVAGQIKQEVRERVKDDLKVEMAESDEYWLERIHVSVPEWTRRLRWSGDARLRYDGQFFDENNALLNDPGSPSEILNTREDRNRFRYRARLGVTAEVNKQVEVGLRLATGNTGDPISTNETAGDYFNKDYFLLDRAYLRIQPIPTAPETAFWGGRFPNPWFCTDLVWDSDLQFEGLALKYDQYLTDWFRPIITGGWFPVQEENFWSDKYMMGAQVAVELKPRADFIFTTGAAYYDYRNIKGLTEGYLDEISASAPQFQQKGNSIYDPFPPGDEYPDIRALAGDYKLLNATAKLDIALFHPVHVYLIGDYVENMGFDAEEIERRIGGEDWVEETVGWQAGIEVGHPSVRNFSEWNVAFYYRYLEADAVLDAFTDSDFHLGGTNCKGWIIQTELGLTKNLWLSVKWSTSDEISQYPLAIDVLNVDLNAKF